LRINRINAQERMARFAGLDRDPDFDLVYPVIEFYWLGAIGYFEREKNFNPSRDQDRIVEYVIERLTKRFPEVD
jgi:hypothetical protein